MSSSNLPFLTRLPPSEEGEWWELSDESRGGLPYYYQTKTAETVWERPSGFVIPLGVLQVSLHIHDSCNLMSILYRILQSAAASHRQPLTTFPR